MTSSGESRWYDTAFGEGYELAYAHRGLEEARADLAMLLERGLAEPFLDLGCGAGRHLAAAAERGLGGVGVDRSTVQLLAARKRGVRAVRGDFRRLPFACERFEAVTCLFSSFGYFDAEGDRAQLAEVHRVLRPGGVLLLDVADPEVVRAGLVPQSERSVGGWTVDERRWLVQDGQRVRKHVHLRGPNGEQQAWQEDLRLFEPRELEQLLVGAGLVLEARWDALHPTDPPAQPRQVLRARRR